MGHAMENHKDLAKTKIRKLVQKWRDVKSEDFSERDTVTKFIRPLFEALDWDFENIEEVREEVSFPDAARTQRLDCVFYLKGKPFAVIEHKPLVGTGSVDKDENYEYVVTAAGKLGAKYAVVTRFHETVIISLDNFDEQSFKVLGKSDYEEKFDDLWNTLSNPRPSVSRAPLSDKQDIT